MSETLELVSRAFVSAYGYVPERNQEAPQAVVGVDCCEHDGHQKAPIRLRHYQQLMPFYADVYVGICPTCGTGYFWVFDPENSPAAVQSPDTTEKPR